MLLCANNAYIFRVLPSIRRCLYKSSSRALYRSLHADESSRTGFQSKPSFHSSYNSFMRELNSQFGLVADPADVCGFRARKQSPVYSEVFRITLSLIIILHRESSPSTLSRSLGTHTSSLTWFRLLPPHRRLVVLHVACCIQPLLSPGTTNYR